MANVGGKTEVKSFFFKVRERIVWFHNDGNGPCGGIDARGERKEMVEVLSSAGKRSTGEVLLSPEAQ